MDLFDFQTQNGLMQLTLNHLQTAFTSGQSVLLFGEPGTGKSMIVRCLEKMKTGKPLLVLENVHALSEARRKEIAQRIRDAEMQVIATAHHSISEFEDIFKTFEFTSLKDRPEDIGLQTQFFLKVQSHLKAEPIFRISAGAQEKLRRHSWPKNTAELESVLDRAVSICAYKTVTEQDIFFETLQGTSFLGVSLAEMEKKLIMQTLQITEQNRTRAAEILGISIRTLRNKLNEYRSDRQEVWHESNLR